MASFFSSTNRLQFWNGSESWRLRCYSFCSPIGLDEIILRSLKRDENLAELYGKAIAKLNCKCRVEYLWSSQDELKCSFCSYWVENQENMLVWLQSNWSAALWENTTNWKSKSPVYVHSVSSQQRSTRGTLLDPSYKPGGFISVLKFVTVWSTKNLHIHWENCWTIFFAI